MNFKQKLVYIGLGALLVTIGYILAGSEWKLSLFGLGGSSLAMGCMMASVGVREKMVCRRLEIVDAAGKMVAFIDSDEDGGRVYTYDKDGKGGVFVGSDEDGGHVYIRDKDGKPAVSIGSDEDGGRVYTYDKNEKPAVSVGSDEDGGYVYTYGKDGEGFASLGNDSFGGCVVAKSEDGTSVASLGITTSKPNLRLTGRDGERWLITPE